MNLTSITVSEKSTTFSCDEAGNIYNKAQTELVCYLNRQGDTVYVPEGVVGLKFGAFQGCTWLKEIHLPEGLEFIGSCAFSGCSGLQELEVPASEMCIRVSTGLLYELNPQLLAQRVFGKEPETKAVSVEAVPRPPVLCPGCPHRGFFYTCLLYTSRCV